MPPYQESIFISCLRSFFKSFFSIIGIFFAFIPIVIILGFLLTGKETTTMKSTVQILPDLNGNAEMLREKDPVILQLDIHGIIGMGENKTEIIENFLLESRKTIFKKDRVKAILLNVNTRGGSIFDSDGIYNAFLAYKKKYKIPIYAFVDGINASGGVYITSAADKIYATPVSIIGSVGVLMGPFLNITKTLEKIGVEALTLTDGKNKDAMNPLRPWKPNESEHFQKIGDFYYQRFVDIVAKSRPKLSKEKLITTYGAEIFVAPDAEKYGYIDDGNSNYKDALRALLKAANIDENTSYQVIRLKPRRKFLEEIFESSSLFKGKIKHEINVASNHNEIEENFAYLYSP